MRIDADERLGPEPVARVDRLDLATDVGRPNLRERARKALVVADERTIEIENVHAIPPIATTFIGQRLLFGAMPPLM